MASLSILILCIIFFPKLHFSWFLFDIFLNSNYEKGSIKSMFKTWIPVVTIAYLGVITFLVYFLSWELKGSRYPFQLYSHVLFYNHCEFLIILGCWLTFEFNLSWWYWNISCWTTWYILWYILTSFSVTKVILYKNQY